MSDELSDSRHVHARTLPGLRAQVCFTKMERGVRRVRVAYVESLCQLYDVGSPHAEFLERLARESGERGWWADYGNTVPHWFADFLGMETVATEVWTYESEYVPGLLQTQKYVEAMASESTPSDAERFTRLRATRWKRLVDDDPLTLRAVLNEAVLCRAVGGPDVMRGQIRHIIETAELPNVTVQVVPFSAGFHPAMSGSFAALRFPEAPMNTVYVEIEGGAVYMEKPPDVQRYTATFEPGRSRAQRRGNGLVPRAAVLRETASRSPTSAVAAVPCGTASIPPDPS